MCTVCQRQLAYQVCAKDQAQVPVMWLLQDAQGQNLCQYREFEPSEIADSEDDDTAWHAQKKGCCMIM